jgi:hypothetical protein
MDLNTANAAHQQEPLLTGSTTLLAKMVSASDSSAELQMMNGRPLTATIRDYQVACDANRRTGFTMALRGIGKWRVEGRAAEDWELVEFEILEVGPYCAEEADPVKCIRALREIAGDAWDNVDVEEFFREMRGDD